MTEILSNRIFVYPVISWLCINKAFSKINSHKTRILVYHGVTREVPAIFNWQQMPVNQFVEQMKYLKKNYNVVSLPFILENLLCQKEVLKRCVALTFDDGYENNFSVVYPVLKEFEFPATFFISTAFIENGHKSLWFESIYNGIVNYSGGDINLSSCGFGIIDTSTGSTKALAIQRLCEQLKGLSYTEMQVKLQCILQKIELKAEESISFPGMSWKQVQTLAADPLITIGGHSHAHPVLSKLSEEEAWKEIVVNKELLENNTGKPMTIFSYPNGNWSPGLASLLRRAGYEFALTTEEKFVTSNPFAVERITVRNPCSIYLFEALVSGFAPIMKRYLGFR